MSLGTTGKKPSKDGPEITGLDSKKAVAVACGVDVDGFNIDTFAVHANEARTRVRTSNLMRMGLLLLSESNTGVSTQNPAQKFLVLGQSKIVR
jgi:hypothetical protein